MRTVTGIAALVGSLVLAQSAAAHTPYLKPSPFAPDPHRPQQRLHPDLRGHALAANDTQS